MESLSALPPGFGFHPTDEEIISHYLKRKVLGQRVDSNLIPVVEIYKHDPWDLPAKCPVPTRDGKWHFFTLPDRKYPNGFRANRATGAGYWKSTGRDRNIKSRNQVIGTKKTLVFHHGRPPNGKRSEWIIHEYYIDESECKAAPELKDTFVLCRVTKRDGWISQTTEIAPEGQEASVQTGERNNYGERPEDATNFAIHEEPLDPFIEIDDIDAILESLLPPNSDVEFVVEQSHEAENSLAVSSSVPPRQETVISQLDQGESDEFCFLTKEDIESILRFDSDFASYDGLNIEDIAAEIIPPSSSQVIGHSFALESNLLENVTTGSTMPSNGGFTSPGSNGIGETGIVIRSRSVPALKTPPSQQIRYGSSKLKVSINRRPVGRTINFSNEKVPISKPHSKEKSVDPSDVAESDPSHQDASEISSEIVSTISGTRRKPLDSFDDDTSRGCSALQFLLKPARRNHLFLSALVIALAGVVCFLVAENRGFLRFLNL